MVWVFIKLIVISAIVYLLVTVMKNGETKKEACKSKYYPYQNAGPLFTPAERSFYGVLNQAVENKVTVFGKVRVADVLVPRKGLLQKERLTAFNKISRKHFDYLLCNNDDFSVICAIELDDKSHRFTKRQQRDEFLNGACSAAGIGLIQVPAKAYYVVSEVRDLVEPFMNIGEISTKENALSPEESVNSERICPKCKSVMVVRIAKKGNNTGNSFWACSGYPKCKHIEKMEA